MEVRYPPLKRYLSDTCRIPYENKANGCDTPLCDTISKGYCAIWGGISHWAAMLLRNVRGLRETPENWENSLSGPDGSRHSQEAKKSINIENLGRNPPSQTPPPPKGPLIPQILYVGASFPFRTQEKGLHKEF